MKRRITYRRIEVSVVREKAPQAYEFPQRAIRGADDVVSLLQSLIGQQTREHFVAIYLDARHRTIGVHVVSVGSAESSQVHPREVFTPAVHLSACALIVAHNHPSGDETPSADDRQVTERLRDAGELLGIELLDHVVLGDARFYSFAEGRSRRS